MTVEEIDEECMKDRKMRNGEDSTKMKFQGIIHNKIIDFFSESSEWAKSVREKIKLESDKAKEYNQNIGK